MRPRDVKAMAFHPLGTARAGADPARAVVDPDLGVHGVRGLYVADGSAVPSSPQVNPQVNPLINPLVSPDVPHVSPMGLGRLAASPLGHHFPFP